MVHQPWGGSSGDATAIRIYSAHMTLTRNLLADVIAKHTRQPLDKVHQIMERDSYMVPEEARELGIIDEVVTTRPPPTTVGATPM